MEDNVAGSEPTQLGSVEVGGWDEGGGLSCGRGVGEGDELGGAGELAGGDDEGGGGEAGDEAGAGGAHAIVEGEDAVDAAAELGARTGLGLGCTA
jgi:hypothetical protein